MLQRRPEENDSAQSKSRNRNNFLGSNSNEDMDVYATTMEQNFDSYQGDNTTDES